MYKVKDVPGVGITIVNEIDGEEYQIAIMRWSDGLNPEVEEAIKRDAHMICYAVNEYHGKIR